MKGYRDEDGFHIVLEDTEGQDLIVLVSEGMRAIKNWKLKEPLKTKCTKSAEVMFDKFSVIFVGDNYCEATKDNPIIIRITEPLNNK